MRLSTGSSCMLRLLLGAALLTLAGCGSLQPIAPAPAAGPASAATPRVVAVAQQMVGAPYRYGGASPRGFDCSGLVYYAYRQAGQAVPRSTEGQYAGSRAVPLTQRAPGDVLFFHLDGKPSHVGIYLGDGRFIHAPSSGKRVEYSSLANDYWSSRLVKVGRF